MPEELRSEPVNPHPGEEQPTPKRVLVCIGPSSAGMHLVRQAAALAADLQAPWFALYVETPAHASLTAPDRERLTHALRLAMQLGGQAVKVPSTRVSQEILDFARSHGVTHLLVGPPRRRHRLMSRRSPVDRLIRAGGDWCLSLIPAPGEESFASTVQLPTGGPSYGNYARGVIAVGLCSGLAALFFPSGAQVNVVMLYLLTVVAVASLWGRGPAILASCLSVTAFAFFFVPHYYSFRLESMQYGITLGVMLLVSTLISNLTYHIRMQQRLERRQERQTAALYEMIRSLAVKLRLEDLLPVALAHISKIFGSQVAILIPNAAGKLEFQAGEAFPDVTGTESEVAEWVYRHGHPAGAGTEIASGVKGIYLPLWASDRIVGVLRLETGEPTLILNPEARLFLEALGNQLALAIAHDRLSTQAEQVQVEIEVERLRNALLSSVSHDLRTPLTVIAGSASSLLEAEASLDQETKRELTQNIYEEARRLDALVYNLLEMSRIQAGEVKLNQEWHVLEEVAGCALERLNPLLTDRQVTVNFPLDLPLVQMDALLMERVFINLLENAIKYSPSGTPIDIRGRVSEGFVQVEITDRGKGLAPGEEERVFEKFYQAAPGAGRGVGLGLSICRRIVEAHGGRIWASRRPGGGAEFRFILPLGDKLPLPVESFPEAGES